MGMRLRICESGSEDRSEKEESKNEELDHEK